MTKTEFAKMADAMKTYYPSANILPNKEAMQLWYEELKDMPYEVAAISLRKHVSTNKFPPTIAEIRSGAMEAIEEPQDWARGWDQFRRAVRKYGYYRPEEAFASMDELTGDIVRRLGWTELCMSENMMQDRANFRMIYEQEQKRRKEKAVLPPNLQKQIEVLREKTKSIGGTGNEQQIAEHSGEGRNTRDVQRRL